VVSLENAYSQGVDALLGVLSPQERLRIEPVIYSIREQVVTKSRDIAQQLGVAVASLQSTAFEMMHEAQLTFGLQQARRDAGLPAVHLSGGATPISAWPLGGPFVPMSPFMSTPSTTTVVQRRASATTAAAAAAPSTAAAAAAAANTTAEKQDRRRGKKVGRATRAGRTSAPATAAVSTAEEQFRQQRQGAEEAGNTETRDDVEDDEEVDLNALAEQLLRQLQNSA
jgi:flagellar biosynthesis GTPase FlhF